MEIDHTAPPVNLNVAVFPPDLGLSNQNSNYMMFKTFTVLGGVGSSTSDITFGGPHAWVCLPIPSGISTTYEQGWEQQEVGMASSGVGLGAEVAKGDATVGGTVKDIVDTGRSAMGGMRGVMGTFGKLITNEATVQRASGRATFSNSYVTYSGPAFRDFSYNFSLKPVDQKESNYIRDSIVSFFKVNSAPKQRAFKVSRIYELPKVFEISYHGKNGPMEHMNKIGKCALTSMNVVYGGDRFAVFDPDSAPVQVDVTVAFKEIQLLDSEDMAAGF